jgi:uncharacterized protein YdaU (DUF1376 family)
MNIKLNERSTNIQRRWEKTMNYYPFHIGDYISATRHLSWEEDAAFRRLLDLYYLRESPIPADVHEAARLVRMSQHVECVESVLRELFFLTPEGWRNSRCDAEIERMRDKQAKARRPLKRLSRRAGRTLNERSANNHWHIDHKEEEK